MDYEEWELIPGDGFLNLREDDDEEETKWRCGSKSSVLDMNYFECPLPNSRIKVVPIQIQQQTEAQEVRETDQEQTQVSQQQVFFKKIAKESQQPEFADIKMETCGSSSPTRAIAPVIRAEAKDMEMEIENCDDDRNGNGNLWKLSLTGLICSFATICVIVFGNQHRGSHKYHHRKIAFNVYNHDHKKRGRVRGVGMSRAHVTFGGFYEL